MLDDLKTYAEALASAISEAASQLYLNRRREDRRTWQLFTEQIGE